MHVCDFNLVLFHLPATAVLRAHSNVILSLGIFDSLVCRDSLWDCARLGRYTCSVPMLAILHFPTIRVIHTCALFRRRSCGTAAMNNMGWHNLFMFVNKSHYPSVIATVNDRRVGETLIAEYILYSETSPCIGHSSDDIVRILHSQGVM